MDFPVWVVYICFPYIDVFYGHFRHMSSVMKRILRIQNP